jgi:chorismate-pyruvate lyase
MSVAEELAQLHFTAQHEAATDLDRVEIVDLDPFLRGLLFTDGTVSRALEAHALAPVAVQAVEQVDTSLPPRIATHLEVEPDEHCMRRRVVMSFADSGPSVWAESYIIPRRLPADFLAVLDGSAQGIGGSLQSLQLESWRDLLWFGLGRSPQWSQDAGATTALTRFYRVLIDRAPALLISEAFAVQLRLGLYRLIGPGDAVAERARANSHAPASR